MARPAIRFEDLPQNWQSWLKKIKAADAKWRRAERNRETTMERLVEETGRAESTVRSLPEYKRTWETAETLRIERAELFLAAVEDGVTAYRIAKYLGYPTDHPVRSAIKSLKGERVYY